MEKKYLYRNEAYSGSGVRKAEDVLLHEIFELGNDDIPDTISERYADKSEKQRIAALLEDKDDMDEQEQRDFVSLLLSIVTLRFGKTVSHALWLADRRTVMSDYGGIEGGADVRLHPTSGIVLSDLGGDGILFGYDSEPQAVELTGSDMHNILSAFETDDPDTYFRLRDKTLRKDMLIPDFFDYVSDRVDLGKYIEEYLKLPEGKERDGFWLRYRKDN